MSYTLCPRCGSGRTVPMFMSVPACDLACEKAPVPVNSNRYWATTSGGLRYCLWRSKADAEWWQIECPGVQVVEVRWTRVAYAPPFSTYGGASGGRECAIAADVDVEPIQPTPVSVPTPQPSQRLRNPFAKP